MKKLLSFLGWLLGCIILLYFVLNIIWAFKPKKHLNIYILDKTVTSSDYPEHKSFVWLLNYERYVRPDDAKYDVKDDYYGFIPVDVENDIFDFRSIRINEIDATASAYDAVYFTDCYGVYSFEWYKGKTKQIHSKVFGGLNQNDFLLLKKVKELGKLAIGEYNMFSAPTNALVRNKTEQLFDLTWSNWAGKYYSTLNTKEPNGPPEWMPNLYESQHNGEWPIDKKGIVFISNDGIIELLVDGEHLNAPIPKIVATEDGISKYKIPKSIEFVQWFEIVQQGSNAEVPAYYELDLNDKGTQLLEKMGIPAKFPAVVKAPNSYTYYFAGDFAENPTKKITSKIIGGLTLNKFIYKYTAPEKVNFFTNFYTPLVSSILDDYYQNKP